MQNTGLPIGITQGGILKVNENLVNSGSLLNNGQIYVGGNWMNTGVYESAGSGVVEIDGNLLQSISDHSGFGTLRLSGSNKTLQTDLTVQNLILNGSILTVAEGSSLEIPASGSIERLPGDYIIGQLYLTGNQTYPIGTDNYYLPVTIINLTTENARIGIRAEEAPLTGPLDNTVAETGLYHWQFSETEDELNVQLGFEGADFLQEIGNAMVVQAESQNGLISSLSQDSVSGSTDVGLITNGIGHPVTMPFLSIGRKFFPAEKPPVHVLNLVSPNDDGKNDFLFIENIEAYPEGLVIIYDRWGTKVYEQKGYDNKEKTFKGRGNLGNESELTEDTYYYVIRSEGEKLTSGFFELMR